MSISIFILLTALNLAIFLVYYLIWYRKSHTSDPVSASNPAPVPEASGIQVEDTLKSGIGNELLVSLFKRSALGIILFDDAGAVLAVNDRVVEILELPEDSYPSSFSELESSFPEIFISGQTEEKNFSTVNTFQTELVRGYNTRYLRVNYFWHRSSICKNSLVVQINDYTNFKLFELDLVKAKEEANALNRMKSIFLANMSHEIRTPMNGIIGFSSLLKEDLTEPDKLEMAERVYGSAIRLMEILEAVLDLSKLEAEHVIPEKRDLDLKEVLWQIYYEYNDLTSRKSLEFNLLLPDEDVHLFIDEGILVKILRQLLSNAVKFTSQGKIELSMAVEHQKTQKIITIAVQDSGIGISLQDQQMIFDDFRQVSEGAGRNYEGIGIGLSIVKRLCEMIDARITIKSSPGKGSRFNIKLTDKINK